MRFAFGYPVRPDWHEPIASLVADYPEVVDEVYFAFPGVPSGRPPADHDEPGRRELCEQVLDDIAALRESGVRLDLLFNGACYGGGAMSAALERHVCRVIESTHEPEVVTTTSPAIAHVVRTHFPGIEVRASVNMRIGTVEAMSYSADLFDSYYVQRDVQRDIGHVRRLRRWADGHGKRLCMLANSGCLRHCPAQGFHDNLVAHADEASDAAPIDGFEPLACRRVLGRQRRWEALMQATWVRPEDLPHYEGLVDVVKLATRAHDRPRLVLDAYARRRFHGNLLDLLEPGYGPLFAPHAIGNDRFPHDWFATTSRCGGRCESCDYCRDALAQTLIDCGDGRALSAVAANSQATDHASQAHAPAETPACSSIPPTPTPPAMPDACSATWRACPNGPTRG